MHFQSMMKKNQRNAFFKLDHIFKISTRSYMFRRLRCDIFREPKVILPKLCVCYVISRICEGREWIPSGAVGRLSRGEERVDILNIRSTLRNAFRWFFFHHIYLHSVTPICPLSLKIKFFCAPKVRRRFGRSQVTDSFHSSVILQRCWHLSAPGQL
jgi:hypothetical protein